MTVASAETRVLAIDGGGTRCRFALARGADCDRRQPQTGGAGRVVCESGPANASTNFNATVECINRGLQSLATLAGIPIETLYQLPAFVGLAGVTSDDIAARLDATLPLQYARYAEDRAAALRGALGNGNGLVAHCGTGSFLASQIDSVQRFAGGWGSVLGDEASAQWVGRKALACTLQQADDFIPATPLIRTIQQRFPDTSAIVEFAASASPDDFGTLAPDVTRHADNGDDIARQIMQSGADYLSSSIDRMGWHTGLAVCLTGGIGPHYRAYLPNEKTAALTEPAGQPLDGAIELAFTQREQMHGHR